MMKRFFLLVAAILMVLSSIPCQGIRDGTVKIISTDLSGQEIEVGAGIICGRSGPTLYILTAFHVVDEGEILEVQLYQSSLKRRAELFRFDDMIDLAVITIAISSTGFYGFYRFTSSELAAVKRNAPVYAIGHPLGEEWTLNSRNVVNNLHYSANEISFSKEAITEGYSGGPLLEQKKNRLLGIITSVKGALQAIAVNLNTVKNYLENWNIPYQEFILPYNPPPLMTTYIFGGLSLGAFVNGVIFNDKGMDTYQPYMDFQNPEAFERVFGTDRQTQFDDAKSEHTIRDISYISSGVFLGLGVVFHLTRNKSPKSQRRKTILSPEEDSFDPDIFYDRRKNQ